MKRKFTCRLRSAPIAKRTRSNHPVLNQGLIYKKRERITPWIAATKTRNYFLNDHLIDWLKLYGHRRRSESNKFTNNNTFTNYIKKKGMEFESEVVNLISTKIPVVHVSDVYNLQSVNKTIEYMKQGIPIIHSAPVRNRKNKTYGIVDLLIRSDYINQLIDEDVPIEPASAHKINAEDYYYLVIDIKYSTLKLRSDGKHLLNSSLIRAYKAQTWIYNEAIGNIQGYTPRYAYLLGRRWTSTCKGVNKYNENCFNKLGIIDFQDVDNFVAMQIKFALKWNREVIKHGVNWSINPPSRAELYPNMKADSDTYNVKKRKLASELGELTMLWRCGIKNRKQAFESGITSWKDPNCSSEKLGVKGKYGQIMDQIIAINRDEVNILPLKIQNNTGNWQQPVKNELYVDFETFSDICLPFDQLPEQQKFNLIYLIGVGRIEDGNWIYKKFICKDPTLKEEFRIMDEFANFVVDMGNPPLFYWHAEKNFWKRSSNSQFDRDLTVEEQDSIIDHWKFDNWIDMCNVFRSEPIVVKGCFGFGLKEIAKALLKHNLISTKLEADCANGMTAMIRAWNCYKNYTDPIIAPIMLDVIKYNEFDVKVLNAIIIYLRSNHT